MDIDLTQYPTTVDAFFGNEQRAKVFLDRYALKNETGDIVEVDPLQMWRRVAATIADSPEEELLFEELLADWKFVPGGRILAGAGTDTEVTYYNCYVVPFETRVMRELNHDGSDFGVYYGREHIKGADSREAIVDTSGVVIDILSRGGGVGLNFSVLRPKGAYLKTLNGTSSGPIDWMHWMSTAVGTVEQGGSRRGAAMFMLDIWHPDIEAFIESKRDLTRITNANISVAVSDDFMAAVKDDIDWSFRFPDTAHPQYNIEWDGDLREWVAKYPEAVKTYSTIRARDLWRKLAEAAWDNGEPGVVFLDRYNEQSTGRDVERLIAVNPCGEQGLGPYSVCNLGSMNFAAYVKLNPENNEQYFDWQSYRRDVGHAVRFLDNVIDENHYFLPENEAQQKRLRRIGLGGMGLADALVMLGLRYGSPDAVAFTEELYRQMKYAAIDASRGLAVKKGKAPDFDWAMWDRPYLSEYRAYVGMDGYALWWPDLRNVFLLTQAPTGTTSILAGVNRGLEPFYALGYWRTDRTGKHWVSPAALDRFDPGEMPSYVVTANEVSVEEHIAMQAAAQRYIDSSVSKTINAPNSHTVEEVEAAYTLAYESGLKGLAYFRDGCGRAQVLTTDKPEPGTVDAGALLVEKLGLEGRNAELTRIASDMQDKVEELQDQLDKPRRNEPYSSRPNRLTGTTHKAVFGGGNAYITVNRDGGGVPFEVFINVGKAGEEVTVLGEALGRVISLALQRGTELVEIASQLRGVGGVQRFGRSLPHAISVALDEELEDSRWLRVDIASMVEAVSPYAVPHTYGRFSDPEPKPYIDITYSDATETEEWGDCPECSVGRVVREEGCSKCHACGWSAC